MRHAFAQAMNQWLTNSMNERLAHQVKMFTGSMYLASSGDTWEKLPLPAALDYLA